MELKVNDEQFKSMVNAALLQAISPEQREALMLKAIDALIRESTNQYDRRSFIQQTFETAVRNVAEGVVKEFVETNGAAMEKIRAVVTASFDKVFADENRQALVDKAASAISGAMFKDRY